ncbi:hypothetical protein OBBRIDRAFT_835327 [Obba rivulosa]|uniref:Uncharacterized protein n=1 Tax=Obba rivulosa TaxID=1052685 RepID=A0A8E2B2G5_9APHY|nr:hypothetical protein OBBRIDRAFT_835327 [Obba rivulosa]
MSAADKNMSLLYSLVPHLGCVTSLKVQWGREPVPDPMVFASLGPIRHLDLACHGDEGSITVFTGFLSVFPNIQDLQLYRIPRIGDVEQSDLLAFSKALASLRLVRLEVDGGLHEVVSDALHSGDPMEIEELSLVCRSDEEWRPVWSILSGIRRSLTDLKLSLEDISEDELNSSIDISIWDALHTNSPLQSLSLVLEGDQLPFFVHMLSQISTSTLKYLSLELFWFGNIDALKHFKQLA